MSEYKKLSLKEKTAQGLMWGGLSNGIQQLLNLFFGIWLSRILDVEDYGVIGMLTIFTLLATTLQESGFTQAIANKKNPTHKDFNAVFWCSSLIGVSLYIILFLAAPYIADFFSIPELTPLARFLFIGFVLSSLGTAHSAYLFKHLMVKQRSISMITGLTISGAVGITMAYNGFAYWGLATQHITYVLCTNGMFWVFSKWRPTLNISFAPIKKMIPFSSRILVTKICMHINNHIYNILLGRFYTKQDVGYFSQANKWNLMGSSILTDMIQGVAQPVLRDVVNDIDRQKRVFLKMLRFTSFLSFPALFGLAFVAPEFIKLALTDKWLNSAFILQILCIGGAFFPINHLLGNLIISRGQSSIYMWNTISLGITQLIFALLLYSKGIQVMVIASVCIHILWTFIWYYFTQLQIKYSLLQLLKEIVPYAFTSIIAILASRYILLGVENIYLLFISKIIIVGVIYFIILALCKASILKESYAFISKIVLRKKHNH